jgi:hypothetical protein
MVQVALTLYQEGVQTLVNQVQFDAQMSNQLSSIGNR